MVIQGRASENETSSQQSEDLSHQDTLYNLGLIKIPNTVNMHF